MITGAAAETGRFGGLAGTADAAKQRAHPLERQGGVPYIGFFENRRDMSNDAELLAVGGAEVRDLLTPYKFPGGQDPINGSALKELEGMRGDWSAIGC